VQLFRGAKVTKIYFMFWILKISMKAFQIGYPYPFSA